jgi:hypothetical protein
LLAVCFSQLATAAYACPLLERALAAEFQTAAHCPGMDTSTDTPTPDLLSALCVEHCKAGQQLVDSHSPLDTPSATPYLFFFVAALDADLAVPAGATKPLFVRATAPPLYVTSSRLRI